MDTLALSGGGTLNIFRPLDLIIMEEEAASTKLAETIGKEQIGAEIHKTV